MRRWIIGVLLLAWAQAGAAFAMDVGMLIRVDGKVEVVSINAVTQPATAFLKVTLGDKLVLGSDARVQIVYFETSRQEVWKGAGEVRIGHGEGLSVELNAEAKTLPPLVARQLVKTPASAKHGRMGMVRVRSLSSDTVESLEKQYREFRATVPDSDTTPEVFLLTGLLEMKEFKLAQNTLDRLQVRSAKNPSLGEVISHFAPLVKQGLSGQ